MRVCSVVAFCRLHATTDQSHIGFVAIYFGYYFGFVIFIGDNSELQKVVEETKVRIETLQPFTLYRFYVIAYSNRAASNASVPVEQRTDEDGKHLFFVSYSVILDQQ